VSDLAPAHLVFSVIGFVVLYAVMLAAYIGYIVWAVRRGPEHDRPGAIIADDDDLDDLDAEATAGSTGAGAFAAVGGDRGAPGDRGEPADDGRERRGGRGKGGVMTIADVWLIVPVLCLTMYIVLDGYDLGIGILLLVEGDRRRRREGVEVVAQTWDINESWLILLGVSLWAGFPAVYGAALPHLYIPLIVMLFCLIVRGFSTELISHRHDTAEAWVRAFAVASLGAAIAQGVALAGLARELTLDAEGDFVGPTTPWDAASVLFTIVVVIGVVAVYTTLGASFMRTKVDSPLAVRTSRSLVAAAAVVLALIVALLGTTAAPLTWSGVQGVLVTALLVLALAAAILAWRQLGPGPRRAGGYRAALTMVVAVLAAIVVGRYPVILSPGVTVEDAAAPSLALYALLIGVGINMLLIVFYTIFAHRTFSGPLSH
uniref:cytochrome d ubiquinol oxidase subunit II n=2 Tax=Bacteria TaxID=2 RepID=UPI0011A3B260